MPFDTGRYIIRTKDAKAYLLVGPIPLIYPPPEVPVKVGAYPEHWFINDGENGAVTVWTREAETNDYKWIVNDENQLFLSPSASPGNFRFESAGNNLTVIGIPNKDLLLTYDEKASPQLTFKKADGSNNQRFEVIRIDRK